MLVFKGIQKTTLIDFPGKVAATLFLPRCNFRCRFCYNSQLVFDRDTGVEIKEEQALKFLRERKDFLDGVCFTGGEPLLHKDLLAFLKRVKGIGLLVKLDTNGSMPGLLAKMISQNCLDFIAMDIKAGPSGYDKAAGVKVDLDAVKKSVSIIRESGLEYEFRMTVLPALHKEADILEVGKWLRGSSLFVLQQFNSSVPLLDKRLEGSKQYSPKELQHFAAILAPFFAKVKVRGL